MRCYRTAVARRYKKADLIQRFCMRVCSRAYRRACVHACAFVDCNMVRACIYVCFACLCIKAARDTHTCNKDPARPCAGAYNYEQLAFAPAQYDTSSNKLYQMHGSTHTIVPRQEKERCLVNQIFDECNALSKDSANCNRQYVLYFASGDGFALGRAPLLMPLCL